MEHRLFFLVHSKVVTLRHVLLHCPRLERPRGSGPTLCFNHTESCSFATWQRRVGNLSGFNREILHRQEFDIMMQLKEIEGTEGHQTRILALWIRSGSDGGPVVHVRDSGILRAEAQTGGTPVRLLCISNEMC